MKIGYQGTNGAYSHLASQILSPHADRYIGFDDFYSCFRALKFDEIDAMVIPIENSYAGRVADVHRLLRDFNIYFHKELIMPINHQLMANIDVKIEDIREIISHEQAIMQCEKTLKEYFKTNFHRDVILTKTKDTALSAKEISENKSKNIAAIASTAAAKEYNLNILLSDVNDAKDNYTNFILMSKQRKDEEFKEDESYLTSIIFEVGNQSGSLSEVLSIVSKNEIDLIKLESYIPGGIKSKSAKFFASFFGHILDKKTSLAMKKIEEISSVYILGSYKSDEKRI